MKPIYKIILMGLAALVATFLPLWVISWMETGIGILETPLFIKWLVGLLFTAIFGLVGFGVGCFFYTFVPMLWNALDSLPERLKKLIDKF